MAISTSLILVLVTIFICCSATTPTKKYCATFNADETGGAKGYFAMEISGVGGWALYKYDVDMSGSSVLDGCDLNKGIAYHIHQKWKGTGSPQSTSAAGSEGNICNDADGHYDPNFACGPKSQWYGSGYCRDLSRTSGYNYNCATEFKKGDYASCEVGDLSGKFGVAPVNSDDKSIAANLLYDPLPPYAYNHDFQFAINAPGNTWESLVLHCDKQGALGYRILCAQFVKSVDGDACHAAGGFDTGGGPTDDNASQQDACANCECQEKGYEYTQDDLVKFIILSIALTIVVNCICAVVGWFFEKKQKKRKDTVIVQHVAPPPSQTNPVHRL